MSDDQPIKRKPGRPRKVRPQEHHETPAIKEGASWHVGVEEQEELKRRHDEQVEKNLTFSQKIGLDPVRPLIEPNSVIQIKTEGKMGQFAIVGDIENDVLYCYAFMPDGSIGHLEVKANECVLISGPKKGMRVIRYERPEKVPTWKED